MAKSKRPVSRNFRDPSRESPASEPQSTSRNMSHRQLEQLRETLDSIVEELCDREQAVDKEQAHLLERLNELDQRQSHLKSLEEIVAEHHATEQSLTDKLESLVQALDQRSIAQPQWLDSALAGMEQRLVDKLIAQQPPQPQLSEVVREIERVQTRSVQSLTEQLTISLQTAISMQLAPLTDELPERLTHALANTSPASPLSTPELARELEKFESRSMAGLAARMTAGLQTALASQWDALTDGLPEKLAALMAQSQPIAAPQPAPQPVLLAEKPDTVEHEQWQARIEALTAELDKTKATLLETEALLNEAIEHPHAPVAQQPSASSDDDLVEALRSEIADLRQLLTAKEHDSRMLEELRGNSDSTSATAPSDESELLEQLEMATCQIIDLRSQNEELNERVTRLQINTAAHGHMPHLGQEGMCWEERKKLLLAQLDAEQEGVEPETAAAKRLEIEDILKTTEAELARRDREIAELRSLVEQQSDARAGVAVGAAAVAQLIESDELVQEEREKLRNLQKSWEEKFRQSEIDLSMERAKLARERLQLEEQKQAMQTAEHEAAHNAIVDPKDKADPKARKWLSRLGLKEEK